MRWHPSCCDAVVYDTHRSFAPLRMTVLRVAVILNAVKDLYIAMSDDTSPINR